MRTWHFYIKKSQMKLENIKNSFSNRREREIELKNPQSSIELNPQSKTFFLLLLLACLHGLSCLLTYPQRNFPFLMNFSLAEEGEEED